MVVTFIEASFWKKVYIEEEKVIEKWQFEVATTLLYNLLINLDKMSMQIYEYILVSLLVNWSTAQGNAIKTCFLDLSIANFQLGQMKRTAVFECREQSSTLGAARLILHCSLSVPLSHREAALIKEQ